MQGVQDLVPSATGIRPLATLAAHDRTPAPQLDLRSSCGGQPSIGPRVTTADADARTWTRLLDSPVGPGLSLTDPGLERHPPTLRRLPARR
jgi:hypothetical protein